MNQVRSVTTATITEFHHSPSNKFQQPLKEVSFGKKKKLQNLIKEKCRESKKSRFFQEQCVCVYMWFDVCKISLWYITEMILTHPTGLSLSKLPVSVELYIQDIYIHIYFQLCIEREDHSSCWRTTVETVEETIMSLWWRWFILRGACCKIPQ